MLFCLLCCFLVFIILIFYGLGPSIRKFQASNVFFGVFFFFAWNDCQCRIWQPSRAKKKLILESITIPDMMKQKRNKLQYWSRRCHWSISIAINWFSNSHKLQLCEKHGWVKLWELICVTLHINLPFLF